MVPTHYLSENKHAGRWYIKIWDFCCLSITQSLGVLNFFVVVVGNSVDLVTALKKRSFVVYLVVSCLSFPLSGVRSESSSEAPVTPTFSFPVACFYRDGECFLFVFFSLVIFPEGVAHISEVPVTHTFSFVSPISIAKASAFS